MASGLGDALLHEALLDAAAAELFVLLAEAGVVGGEALVAEVAELFELGDDGVDGGFAFFAGFGAVGEAAAEVALGFHLGGEGADGVFEQAGVFERGLGGFGAEWHAYLPPPVGWIEQKLSCESWLFDLTECVKNWFRD